MALERIWVFVALVAIILSLVIAAIGIFVKKEGSSVKILLLALVIYAFYLILKLFALKEGIGYRNILAIIILTILIVMKIWRNKKTKEEKLIPLDPRYPEEG